MTANIFCNSIVSLQDYLFCLIGYLIGYLDCWIVLSYYDNIMININKKLSLSVRDQIKRQIRLKIESGELTPEQPLPSVRDLSSFLNVNRNTIALAYQELIAEGILKAEPGAGTFVHSNPSLVDKKNLRKIIGESLDKAQELGFSVDEITESFFNCLASLSANSSTGSIIVVECNEPLLEHLRQSVAEEMQIRVESILIEDLENAPDKFRQRFHDCTLVVCGFNHLEELSSLLHGFETKITGIMLRTDLKILNAIRKIPDGEAVGYVCVSQRSADTFYNSALFSGHKKLKRVIVGANDGELLSQVLADCNTVFVTNFALSQLDVKARPGQQIIPVDIDVDRNSMKLIKERFVIQNQAKKACNKVV